ncbi:MULTISPECIES: alkaline shock response membrane anchor protein AmaP [Streptomyces]|uniref:alkaline shock response membrane anchor protein AmaP n=1 Tax=Streptomyces herbicida TaxID=3065675 RepID=UPI0029302D1A|nr:alkaline shock response membrane anchor protein AmaP [Streptomyces sp. NEAU-HV9]
MIRTVNRVLLALIGAGLFALGAAVLLGGLDLQRRWNLQVPIWWPLRGPHDVVLGVEGRTRFRDHLWWWPVVIAVLALLLILLLWWLLTQLRRHRLAMTLVDSGDGEGARLRGGALESVLSAEAEAMDGLAQAHDTPFRLLLQMRRPPCPPAPVPACRVAAVDL